MAVQELDPRYLTRRVNAPLSPEEKEDLELLREKLGTRPAQDKAARHQ